MCNSREHDSNKVCTIQAVQAIIINFTILNYRKSKCHRLSYIFFYSKLMAEVTTLSQGDCSSTYPVMTVRLRMVVLIVTLVLTKFWSTTKMGGQR